MIITRKIQLLIDEPEKEKFIEKWKYMRQLSKEVFLAANTVINNLYFNDAFVGRILLTDEELKSKSETIESDIKKITKEMVSEKDGEKKAKLKIKRAKMYKVQNGLVKEAREKMQEFYIRSQSTELYHIIGNTFPEMPSQVSSCIAKNCEADYKNDYFDVKLGKRSIRNYKNGMPIPFQKVSMRLKETDLGIKMHWLKGITFNLFFGRDKSNNREIVKRAMDGEYKYSDSSIQIKDNKIFLLFIVDIPVKKVELNPNISVGVDLGIATPAYCALSEGFGRLAIGNKEEFLKVRMQMQSRYRRTQSGLRMTSGGKGRRRKMRAMNQFKDYEKNWVKTYNHTISHQIVKFAKDNFASTIKLEFLEGFGQEDKNKFILRNWSYYQLQQMIAYKAEREGMKVVFVDPYHTSQTCSCCGHYEDGQRETQSLFICKNPDCENKSKDGSNYKMNADYNAAKNIAASIKIVDKKEECEYYKVHSKEEIVVL